MAFEIPNLEIGVLVAAADLSAAQYKGVKVTNASGVGQISSASVLGEAILGVLQNKPVAGEAAEVRAQGVTKVVLGGTVVPGDKLAVKADGTFQAAASTQNIVAVALEGGASGEYGSALLKNLGIAP